MLKKKVCLREPKLAPSLSHGQTVRPSTKGTRQLSLERRLMLSERAVIHRTNPRTPLMASWSPSSE